MVGQPFGAAVQGNRERLSNALSAAVASHQRGDLAEARRLYKLVLRESPDHFDALHLLGVVEAQRGHHDKAVQLIRDALQINPNSAERISAEVMCFCSSDDGRMRSRLSTRRSRSILTIPALWSIAATCSCSLGDWTESARPA